MAMILSLSTSLNAQFLSGYGFTAGGTGATEVFDFENSTKGLKMKHRYGFNASVFLEFFSHPNMKWLSELQFNQKGARDILFQGNLQDSRTNYLCFNNFLKYRIEGYDFSPYVLAGPRLEYLVGKSGPYNYNKLHYSVSVGLGSEFNFKDPWIYFVEFHYNPDVSKSYSDKEVKIVNRAVELRLGIKYNLLSQKDFDACPPVFL